MLARQIGDLFQHRDRRRLDRRWRVEVRSTDLEVQDLLAGLLQRRRLLEHAPNVREWDRVEALRTAQGGRILGHLVHSSAERSDSPAYTFSATERRQEA